MIRIGQSTFYDQYKSRQSQSAEELNVTYEQITTAKKISDGYQDPLKMVNTLNLDSQNAFFNQINKIAEQAVFFSRNTDTVLGDFQKTLTQFKQKLIDAANGNHSLISLNSIAKELEVLIRHLSDVSNTSINRNYLFSGSNVTDRPIDENLEYTGNKDDLGILLGRSDSLAPYNISGYELFYGKDSDFSKKIMSNVRHFNKTLLRPDIMTTDLKKEAPVQEYVNGLDSIRDLMGDNDDNTKNDKEAIFYFRGQNIYGDVIKDKIKMDSGDNITTLLSKIEELYDGFVDATMSENGQFVITSRVPGNENIDFHMFGAADRDGTPGKNKADVDNIDDLLKEEDVDIIEFVYSSLSIAKIAPSAISSVDTFDNKKIYLRSSFLKTDQSSVALSDELRNIFHKDLKKLTLKGIDVDGKTFNKDLNVDEYTNIKALFEDIQSVLSGNGADKKVIVSMIHDKLVIQENVTSKNQSKATSARLELIANDGQLNAFSGIEAMNMDRVSFTKNKNTLSSQLSQLDRDGNYATRSTKLSDVAQGSLNNATFKLDITNINGEEKSVDVDLKADTVTFKVDGTTFNAINDSLLYVASGSKGTVVNVPDYYDLDGVKVGDKISINGSTRTITRVDEQYKLIEVDSLFSDNLKSGDIIEFVDPKHKRTNYNNMTYGQLMDIVGMVMSDSIPSKNDDSKAYEKAISTYENKLDITLDIRGKLKVVDKVESLSKIDLAIYDKNSNDFTNTSTPSILFSANNAVVVDTPSIDFFKNLQDAVNSVKHNIVSTDAYSTTARSSGIRGGIKAIDHLSSHIAKMRTVAGTNSQTISNTVSRLGNIITTTKELKNQVIATDIAETMVKFNEQALNYSALLKIINRINELTLANYYR